MDTQFSEDEKERLKKYNLSERGLSSDQVAQNIKTYGQNIIAATHTTSPIFVYLLKFTNPLILILLFASFLSAWTHELANFFIIFAIILISTTLEFYQEHESKKAAERLQAKVAVHATVIRDGEKKEIPISKITYHDLLFLSLGDIIPADSVIVKQNDFHVDESSLTGESFPVQKNNDDSILMGSTVMNGEAYAVVAKIGVNTEYGKIAKKLTTTRPETNFEKGIRQFGLLVIRFTLILVFFIFVVNIFLKKDVFDSFLFALALAVGLTPELLPVIITVNLAQGAKRMAKKGVIVKHLPSIQNFGSMNILCTDKTGTLTEDKIELERYENAAGEEDKQVLGYAYLNSYFQSNRKNPLDEAILAHKEAHQSGFEKIDELPFDFVRKRLSVIIEKNEKHILVCKGAPQEILQSSKELVHKNKNKTLTSAKREALEKRFEELSNQGYRVLAISIKTIKESKEEYKKEDESDLIFIGFTAFFDPPKVSAKEIIQDIYKEGIDLKVLTGDNEFVTKKVCEELKIPIKGILLQKDLERMSDEALSVHVLSSTIFARLTPDTKQRIITALKKTNNVVGYLGDGVNDAPSLRSADIGISVNNAVDVAKDAADFILVTKSLHVLHEGVVEGRITFQNTLKYIYMGMGSNFGNMFSVSLASLFLPFIPMLPVQILTNNLLYDVSQLTLPTDSVDQETLLKPQQWDISRLKRFILYFGPLSSLFDIITFSGLLYIFHSSIATFQTGWFIESAITQSLIIFALRTRRVPFWKSKPSYPLIFSAIGACIGAFILIQPVVGKFLGFSTLPFTYWIFLAGILAGYFILVEITKTFFYKIVMNSLTKKT